MTVFVVGNVTEDLVFRLPQLPRDGETMIADDRLSDMGGKGLNQAVLLARADCAVSLFAAIGQDKAGRRARALVFEELPGSELLFVDGPTDQSIIYVAAGGENHIVSTATAANQITPALVKRALTGIGPSDTLVVQGNLSIETTRVALSSARQAGAWTVANPSPIRWDWDGLWPDVGLVILNRSELKDLAGDGDTLEACARLREAGVTEVIVTLGGDGAELHDERGIIRIPALRTAVVDTAGAGDTFCAGYVAATVRGALPEDALRCAVAAAAITVSRHGTASAFPDRASFAAILGRPETAT